ncbi:leucine-rich repeat domain-containing protein [Lacrimispora sp. NSJ-141]|uniref:Leucine-rich repeat domain-containing protein n=1 Tax=Lientehia hominis TaxID=2897778 RepID=A0AAP2RL32_9FIRM|nr:leucine-rich repeat domain-containing protein [Lientehia hominis]MCD2492945.1 leucine-rich repeat domain-containing protein [Lientehia hominis]
MEWIYARMADGIRICGALGEKDRLEVPEEIGGCPVTEIGPYAFSASETPRRFLMEETARCREKDEGIFEKADAEKTAGMQRAVKGDRLSAVSLPDTVKVIGDYAFYGCGNLETISFTDSLKRIGSGALMGCSAVKELRVIRKREGAMSLCQMLSELRYALAVTIQERDGEIRLIFPEYYEVSVENIPARIFETHVHGTGYRYRQCFRGGEVDYRTYDGLFCLAVSQEPAQVVTELALSRLRYPKELSAEAKNGYLSYFSSHVREAGEYLLKQDDLDSIRLIAKEGGFGMDAREMEEVSLPAYGTEDEPPADGAGDFYMASLGEGGFGGSPVDKAESYRLRETAEHKAAIDVMLEMAGQMGRTECLGFLMDFRHRKGTGDRAKRVFEL